MVRATDDGLSLIFSALVFLAMGHEKVSRKKNRVSQQYEECKRRHSVLKMEGISSQFCALFLNRRASV